MLKTKRQKILLELLEKDDELKIGELASHLGITTMTLHRDLKELEFQNLLKRVHGGAIMLTDAQQPTFYQRKVTERLKKIKIAREAVKYINEGQIVFFDAGTTTLELAEVIPKDLRFTAITTGLQTAMVLSGKGNIQVITTGGLVDGSSLSNIGKETKDCISKFHSDIAFISTKVLNSQFGTNEAIMELIEIKQEIVKNSEQAILLIDSTKFGKKSLSEAIPLKDIDLIITDEDILKSDECNKYGDKLIIAH